MLRSFLLSVLAASVCAAADQPKPDVPDPYGLGERLALIDWLREHGVKPPVDASDQQLVELYWAKQKPDPDEGSEDFDQAMARDRIARLRRELKERGVAVPLDADEARLQKLLAEAKDSAAHGDGGATGPGKSGDKPVDAEATRRRATNALEDLAARRDRTTGDVHQAQAEAEAAAAKLKALVEPATAAKTRAEQAQATLAQCQQAVDRAESQYKQESANFQSPSVATRKARDTARDNLAAAQADVDRSKQELSRLADDAAAMQRKVDQAQAQQQRLSAQLGDLEKQTIEAQERAGGDGKGPAMAGPLAAPSDDGGASQPAPASDPPAGVNQVVAAMRAAVVMVVVEERGTGSGFFISRDGYCLTNAHVVGDGKKQIAAVWDSAAGRKAVVMRVVSISTDDDLALLHADGSDSYPCLRLREGYDLARPVLTAGFPQALSVAAKLGTSPNDLVVSRGTLNAVRRRDDQSPAWLQHDAKIANGSSGGPLVDAATGDAIGINTAILTTKPVEGQPTADPIPLAIPAKTAFARFGAFIKP